MGGKTKAALAADPAIGMGYTPMIAWIEVYSYPVQGPRSKINFIFNLK
jgi:hypothetical protein